ncbi:outer membrane immunogenic protein [Sphingomonas jinjuensis]|uniref:Outer membrane immunogenic protein n=1 Tax=Sphingomonas jinjuensis TaxID=535907 RepID=A0A840F3Q3_9SPHN|nr:porin family protein [Sphingomonas jinjuensis]MBB4152470.1 outer membrane immunogenic protein [Sphingomonas jinjuensis]
MYKGLLLAAAVVTCPTVASAQDFAGARIEARIGYETPTVTTDGDDEVYKIGSAASFGGEIGYDLAVSKTVTLGAYGTYETSGVSLCDGSICLDVNHNIGAGGRVGIEISPKAQLYGKLGYTQIKISARDTGLTASDTADGVQGAIGIGVNFGRRFYGAVEINYGDYGRFYDLNLQRRQLAGSLGVRF